MSNAATESDPLISKKETDVEAGDNAATKPPSGAPESGETVMDDVIDILKLAFPIFITSFSWVGVSSIAMISTMERDLEIIFLLFHIFAHSAPLRSIPQNLNLHRKKRRIRVY